MLDHRRSMLKKSTFGSEEGILITHESITKSTSRFLGSIPSHCSYPGGQVAVDSHMTASEKQTLGALGALMPERLQRLCGSSHVSFACAAAAQAALAAAAEAGVAAAAAGNDAEMARLLVKRVTAEPGARGGGSSAEMGPQISAVQRRIAVSEATALAQAAERAVRDASEAAQAAAESARGATQASEAMEEWVRDVSASARWDEAEFYLEQAAAAQTAAEDKLELARDAQVTVSESFSLIRRLSVIRRLGGSIADSGGVDAGVGAATVASHAPSTAVATTAATAAVAEAVETTAAATAAAATTATAEEARHRAANGEPAAEARALAESAKMGVNKMGVERVIITKSSKDERFNIMFSSRPQNGARIKAVMSPSAALGKLFAGDVVLFIQGQQILEGTKAVRLLKEAQPGEIEVLKLSADSNCI